jgi:pyrroloquinoline quinone (PQQ) biosynthesis protein C
MVAISDVGLTSALLGKDDAQTRLKTAGPQALSSAAIVRAPGRDGADPSKPSPVSHDIPGSFILAIQLVSQQHTACRHHPAAEEGNGDPIADLMTQSLQHRAVRHPYLSAMASGELPDPRGALRDFARHYHGYSSHFPRYLTALISRLEDDEDRRELLENLQGEGGSYSPKELGLLQAAGISAEWVVDVPHPELFRRFRRALGVGDDDPAEEHLEVTAWRELLLSVISQGTAAEAVGAMGLGTEGIVPAIYPAFARALRRLRDVAPRDGVFFPLHTLVDDHHQASLRALAGKLATSSRGRRDLALGMTKALALRDAFWGWLHQRALAMDPA